MSSHTWANNLTGLIVSPRRRLRARCGAPSSGCNPTPRTRCKPSCQLAPIHLRSPLPLTHSNCGEQQGGLRRGRPLRCREGRPEPGNLASYYWARRVYIHDNTTGPTHHYKVSLNRRKSDSGLLPCARPFRTGVGMWGSLCEPLMLVQIFR